MDKHEASFIGTNNYLQHHGIQGQKWGVRRFQNSDGSLTSEGKRRRDSYYNKTERKAKKEEYKKRVSNIKTMSDQDLDSRINRLKKEKELKTLEKESAYRGKKAVEDILSQSGKQVATKLLTAGAIAAGGAIAAKLLSDKNFSNVMVDLMLANLKPKK